MVADDHSHRAAEDGSSVAVGAGCQKDRPVFGVWHCGSSTLNGYICSHRSLASLLMVSVLAIFTCTGFYDKENFHFKPLIN